MSWYIFTGSVRRSLLLNLAFSVVSYAALFAAMPTAGGLTDGMRARLSAFAQDSVLLSPIVHRVLKPN